MEDLAGVLSEERLEALRSGYRHDAMLAADLAAVRRVAPDLAHWNVAISETFYGPQAPTRPIDRERCLIVLIATTGPPVSLALHVYWGLMEGLSVHEIVHLVGLAGCYGGLPRAMFALQVVRRVLGLLSRFEPGAETECTQVVENIMRELAKAD